MCGKSICWVFCFLWVMFRTILYKFNSNNSRVKHSYQEFPLLVYFFYISMTKNSIFMNLFLFIMFDLCVFLKKKSLTPDGTHSPQIFESLHYCLANNSWLKIKISFALLVSSMSSKLFFSVNNQSISLNVIKIQLYTRNGVNLIYE